MKTEQRIWTEKDGWKDLQDNDLRDNAQLVLVFGSYNLLADKARLDEIKSFYPQTTVIGCSTAGEILESEVLDDSLVVTAVSFEKTKIICEEIHIDSMENSVKAGEDLAEKLNKEDLQHVFVLSDGLNVNGSGLAKGFSNKLSADVAVTGGLAGDGGAFKETLVFLNGNPKKDKIIAVGFYGKDLKVGYGSMGGWDSFGADRLVTRSEGNVLFELDGKPALDLYKEYLGEHASGLPATGLLFPLSLKLNKGDATLVRTILAVDEKKGSLTFAGDIPEKSYVRLMKANFDRLVDGAEGAANMSIVPLDSKQTELAILISCVGRKLVLKQRVEEEVESVKNVLGKEAAITGFYSYGEICPVSPMDKKCELHNQTMTITTLSEQ